MTNETWTSHLQCQFREAGHGFGRGLQGLVGGVADGVTGVVRAPLQGYNDGSGVVAGDTRYQAYCVELDALL